MSDSTGDTSALANARLNYTAASINTLSYGIYIVLALMGMHRLLQRRRGWKNISMVYSSLMFVITTAWFITNNESVKVLLVEVPLNPTYTPAYDAYCSKTNIAAVALNTLQIIGSDALLIYRAYVITNFLWAPVLLPFIGWLAYIGLSVVANLSCTPLIANVQHLDKVVIAYYSLTAGCTMYCTLLICGRLLHHQRMLGRYGINSNTSYATLSAIMAESGLFYSVASLVNGVMIIRGDPNSTIASAIFTGLSYITQAQIILRIALGVDTKGQQEKFKTVSTVMAFGNPSRTGSGAQTSHGTVATGHADSDLWADKADLESAAGTHGEEFELKSIPEPGFAEPGT